MHCRVAGWETAVAGVETAATACAPSEVPQCIQKAALAFTVPPQRGQLVVAGSASATWTGEPHSGQNFLPVTSWPQFVQLVMAFPLDVELDMSRIMPAILIYIRSVAYFVQGVELFSDTLQTKKHGLL
jgi:hypothetical protein